MEDLSVRTIKGIIAAVFIIASLDCVKAGQADPNDLSAYYGFGEMEVIKLDWDIKNLRVADFSGDGLNDIAVVNNEKSKIELLIQKKNVGPAEPPVSVDPEDADINLILPPTRFATESVPVSQRIYSFACGDIDSDGLVDLVFYGEPRGLYVILQKPAETGAGPQKTLSWRPRKKIKIDDGLLTPNALVVADLNNDGANDIVLAGQNGIYIILQKKDGPLAEPVKYPTTDLTLGVETGDLNGDGLNDLVLITNDGEKPIHTRFGLKTGQFGPQERFFIEKPYAIELCNIDGSPGDEILTVDGRSGRLMCYKFATEKEKDTDWPILFYPLPAGEGSSERDLVLGDFNGDGLVDIVISDPGAAEIIFYRQTPDTGLAEPVRFPVFSDVTTLSAADIDGDGKSELAILSPKEKIIGKAVFKNDRFSFPQPVKVIGEPVAFELADLDNDKNIDCLYVAKETNDVRNLRAVYNFGAASIPLKKKKSAKDSAADTQPLLKLKGLTADPEGLKVLDVDQDGLLDVLIFVKYEKPMLVRQTQKGKFELVDSPNVQASLIKDAALRSTAVADVDEKPGDELLIAQKNFARSLVFAKGELWSIVDQYNAKSTENEISSVAAFNIDDKKTRPSVLLLDGQKGQLQILKAGEDKTYRFEKELNVGKWTAVTHLKMLFAPLAGSNAKNILIFDGEKFALITPLKGNNPPQYLEQLFSYETKIKEGIYGNLTAGDINSDKRIDIVMVEYKQNHIEILTIGPDGKPLPAMRFKVFEQKSYRDSQDRSRAGVEPRELKIADVTGDGKNDLITIIHDRIIIYPQD
jgi:hypothetical protein